MDVCNKVARKHTDKRNKKNKVSYNLIVIRTSPSGINLSNSQLCEKCVLGVNNISNKTGIKIKKIFYTDINGIIQKTTPYRMLFEEQHISAYYQNRSYKSKSNLCLPCKV
jgi:hypothetical protein